MATDGDLNTKRQRHELLGDGLERGRHLAKNKVHLKAYPIDTPAFSNLTPKCLNAGLQESLQAYSRLLFDFIDLVRGGEHCDIPSLAG